MQMIILGVVIAVVLIWLKMPVMSVAIGIYLPLGLSVPIMLGGVLSYFAFRSAHIRVDGELRDEPSEWAVAAAKEVENRGVLIGAGFIAGESILGVLVALLIVLEIDLTALFSTGVLNNFLSLVFFGWFVLVFLWLATRTLPNNGNLIRDFGLIFSDILDKIKSSSDWQNNWLKLNKSIKGCLCRHPLGRNMSKSIPELEELARKCRVEIVKWSTVHSRSPRWVAIGNRYIICTICELFESKAE